MSYMTQLMPDAPVLTLRYIAGTNVAYLVVRDEDDEPETVALGRPYQTPADHARSAAIRAGWVHMTHTVRTRLTDGSLATLEFFRGDM